MEKILIDVREQDEYNCSHISKAINIPSSSFNVHDFEPFKDKKLELICFSGRRANTVKERLEMQGFKNVHVLDLQMQDITLKAKKNSLNDWSIDRQFRLILGLLLLIFLVGGYYISPNFIIIPIMLCFGLIFTSIINKCFLKLLVAKLPFNKNKLFE